MHGRHGRFVCNQAGHGSMKDRQGSQWTARLLLPVAVILQVGLLWLAMHVWNPLTRHDAPALPAESGAGDARAAMPPVADARRVTDAARLWGAAEAQPPRWLPPLTDRTRMLLTSFEPMPAGSEPTAARSGPESGSPRPATDGDVSGPELGSPWPVTDGDVSGPGDAAGSAEMDWHDEDRGAGTARLAPPEAALGAAVVGPEPEDVAPGPAAPAEPQPVVMPPETAMPIGGTSAEGSEPVSQQAEKLRQPWQRSGRRSQELEMIAREADVHTRRAFELAGRRAHFSARSELIMALRLLAQGLDTDGRTDVHSEALALGLRALREADDFAPSGSRLEADLNMPGIIAGHRTPVLKDFPVDEITPLAALQRYFTFAQEQLAIAVGQEVAGSMALHGLGKLHAALADHRNAGVKAAEPKAVVFYQAALLVYPQNYMASNDLGVLLARAGHYGEAGIALGHSLAIRPHAIGWRNLAVVYRQLGRMDLALRAAQRWQAYRKAEIAGAGKIAPASNPMVRWVTPGAFAGSYAQTPDEPRNRPAAARSAATPADSRSGPAARQAASRAWRSRQAHSRD